MAKVPPVLNVWFHGFINCVLRYKLLFGIEQNVIAIMRTLKRLQSGDSSASVMSVKTPPFLLA